MKIVLMYHDIVTEKDKSSGFQNTSAFQYKVDARAFEEQVKSLSPEKVIFSFDDGGISFLKTAAPILEKYGHKGLFFIATDYIGTPGFLNAEQIRELNNRGHIIGSHSCSHPTNMALMSEDAIKEEWVRSIESLESILEHKVDYASIPNGEISNTVIHKAQEIGIHYLFTSEPTEEVRLIANMKLIGRYVIHSNTSLQETKSIVYSATTRKFKHLRWKILMRMKHIIGKQYDKIKSYIVLRQV